MPFIPFLYEYPLLTLLQGGFTIWMLVDASRRRVDMYWYWLIIGFPLVGAWAYFFTFKLGDFRGRGSSGGGLNFWPFVRRESLSELRYRVQQTPTLASHLALAERLVEHGEHAEAKPHLEAALVREPDHCQVLYNLGVCQNALGHPDLAVPITQKVLARDRCWGNYKAWHLLIDARVGMGDQAAALAACRELVLYAPTLEHKCLLAEHQLAEGLNDEAWDGLDKALQDHNFSPGPIRRRNWRWARKARTIMKQIP